MTYCYVCDNGHKWEITVGSFKDRPKQTFCQKCQKAGQRDYQAEQTKPPPPTCYADQGYLWSDACGVSSDKIEAEKKRYPHHIFRRTEEGTYQRGFRSASHRRGCLKELGMYDRQSYL